MILEEVGKEKRGRGGKGREDEGRVRASKVRKEERIKKRRAKGRAGKGIKEVFDYKMPFYTSLLLGVSAACHDSISPSVFLLLFLSLSKSIG